MEADLTTLLWECLDMATNGINWVEFNQHHLTVALGEVRACLERHVSAVQHNDQPATTEPVPASVPTDGSTSEPASALEILTRSLNLSPFERATLLLCAGMELDSSLANLCAAAQGGSNRNYPTFSLALAALPAPHWSALNPAAPLRRWRLIEISTQAGTSLTSSPLGIDERILHFLTGLQHLDERLTGLLRAVHTGEDIAPSHAAQARL